MLILWGSIIGLGVAVYIAFAAIETLRSELRETRSRVTKLESRRA